MEEIHEDAVVDINSIDTKFYCFKEVQEVLVELGTSVDGLNVEEVVFFFWFLLKMGISDI